LQPVCDEHDLLYAPTLSATTGHYFWSLLNEFRSCFP
jgi:hypothetical protein